VTHKLGNEQPDYGNWVSVRLLFVSGVLVLLFGGLSIVLPVLAVVTLVLFVCFAYLTYVRHRFSPGGGNVQARIWDLVLDHLDWNGQGKALDIGCGNAPLTIELAKKYPNAEVTGIDTWGGAWEFSRSVCERNALIEGVAERVTFRKASASALPFEEGEFDAAVSNLAFHEVADASDKREVIREALRVVKKGGVFAFQDLFSRRRTYGQVEDLLETIRSWGIDTVEYVDTSQSGLIPRALKLPFVVGPIGILRGTK
jgi:SAM-dependent methyltransferase